MNTDQTPGRTGNTTLEDFVAELTAAAYPVALRHGAGNRWLDLQLELWHALRDAANKWNRGTYRPDAPFPDSGGLSRGLSEPSR
jgi:hypothetical protein